MNIVAFNSSPRDDQTSKTHRVLEQFLAGARQAGAVTETIPLRQHHIKYCLGCFGCWLKTQGRCVQKDDMSNILIDKFQAADIVVLATPLYHFTMNACMKTFVERTLPLLNPEMEDDQGRTEHPWRSPNPPRMVVLSVCAFPEMDNFAALSLTMKKIWDRLLIAELYRHSSEFFDVPLLLYNVQEVMDAAFQAGVEVVEQGAVSEDTMDVFCRELAPREMLIAGANDYWRQQLAQPQD